MRLEDVVQLLLQGQHIIGLQFVIDNLQRFQHLADGQVVGLGNSAAIA